MRHQVAKKHFGRDTKHRQAMITNLVRNLLLHGEITTTKAKAKETKRWADKLISKAQTDTVATRRTLHQFFGKRDVVNTLVERIAPLFTDRKSGFTTSASLGVRRGDNTEMMKLELIKKPEVVGTFKPVDQKTSKTVKQGNSSPEKQKNSKPEKKTAAKKASKAASTPAPAANKKVTATKATKTGKQASGRTAKINKKNTTNK